MKKAHTPMSYHTFSFIANTLPGILWFTGGILSFINKPIFNIIRGIIFLCASAALFFSVFYRNREHSDEMSEQSTAIAGNTSMLIVTIIIVICTCILPLLPDAFLDHLDWKDVLSSVFGIIIGLLYLIKGIVFAQLEDE